MDMEHEIWEGWGPVLHTNVICQERAQVFWPVPVSHSAEQVQEVRGGISIEYQ